MNFKLIRHLRLAAFVAELIGFAFHSTLLFWGGVGALVLSYQFSIHKMEKAFQKVEEIKIETEDN